MYHDFLGPRGLQGTHMDTLKPKNSKSITFTVRGGFFTFWAILAHSVPYPLLLVYFLWEVEVATTLSFLLSKAEYWGFHMKDYLVLYINICFFRIIKKPGG